MDTWKKQFGSTQLLILLLTIAVAIYLLQISWQFLGMFSDAFVILFFAWIISVVFEPSVERVSTWTKLRRGPAAGIIYTAFFGILVLTVILFIPALGAQMQTLAKVLPSYFKSSPEFVHTFSNTIFTSLQGSISLLPSVATFLFYVFLVLIISVYLVIDKERFVREFYNLLPKKWHEHAVFTQELIDKTFGSFLRVQLLVGIIAGIATWIVLRIFSVDFAASTAVIAGILTIIPLVGPVLGIIPPVVIAFLANPTIGLIVFLVLLAFQQVLFNIVIPKILGKAFKLHPIVVLLSFIVGYKILGPIGAIFGVPVLSILVVTLHRLYRHFMQEAK